VEVHRDQQGVVQEHPGGGPSAAPQEGIAGAGVAEITAALNVLLAKVTSLEMAADRDRAVVNQLITRPQNLNGGASGARAGAEDRMEEEANRWGVRDIPAEEEKKELDMLLKRIPHYNPITDRWEHFLHKMNTLAAAFGMNPVVSPETGRALNPITHSIMKNALYQSLVSTQTSRVMGFEPQLEPELSFKQYADRLAQQFAPEEESSSMKMEFESRTQRKDEPVLHYLTDKQQLFRLAYGANGDFAHYKRQLINGLANPELRSRSYNWEWMCSDYVDLKTKIQSSAVSLKQGILAGHIDAPLIGLSNTYRGSKVESRTREVNQMEEELNAVSSRNMPARCFDCGSYTHFIRSPLCKEPGARKFATAAKSGIKKKVPLRGRAIALTRGRGPRRGETGATVNYMEPDDEEVEEDEDGEEQEDGGAEEREDPEAEFQSHFLG